MVVSQVHNRYYSKYPRGYYIIRKFFSKYKNQFESKGSLHFNDFLHYIYLNLSKIDRSNIVRNEINYILSAIHVQCRALLYETEIKNNSRVFANNNHDQINKPNELKELLKSENDELTQQFLYQLSLFRLTIKDREIRILNDLIDGKSREDIMLDLGLSSEALDSTLIKLRKNLAKTLKSAGISLNYLKLIFDNKDK